MSKTFFFVAFMITMIMAASLVAAQAPEGVEPGAWAKVEVQLEARGVDPHSKADRDVPVEVAKLLPTPDLTGENAAFGRAVAMDGDLIVVGAPGANQGEAYVFDRHQGGVDAWGQVAVLTASDGAVEDNFASTISINGDTIVVGAPSDDDNGLDSGSAYIFSRNQDGIDAWGQVAKLVALDGAGDDKFGWSVAVSGENVVVGAIADDDDGSSSGSAYVFGRNQGGADAWGQVTKLLASDGASYDLFGWSVAVSGENVVVGAIADDDNGSSSGSAYVFGRNEGGADAWGQVVKLTASDGASNDEFGSTVDASGDTVVVGARKADHNDANSGSAYIFGRNEGGADAWGQVAKLTASDGAYYDSLGQSVAISGDTVVVGAPGDDDNGSSSGSAYIFGRNEGGADAWGEVMKQAAPDFLTARGDQFGYRVATEGDTVVVGAPGDDNDHWDSGAVYVFSRSEGRADGWDQAAKLAGLDGAGGDSFGFSVAISGDIVVVGARQDNDIDWNSGAVYIFGRNEGGADAWGQVAKISALDGASYDYFGHSVTINGDTVVVGATGDDDYGSESGSAYVFGRNEGGIDAWGQVTKLTASDGASFEEFGHSVGISGDTAVVGVPFDSGLGSAYVFDRHQGGVDAWGQVAKLTDSGLFGWAVSIRGDTVVAGAIGDDDLGYDSGSASVFDLGNIIFVDGFETGDTIGWTVTSP